MNIPNEAAEKAAEWLPHGGDCEVRPHGAACTCWNARVELMRNALEESAPIILSHEIEQTRLAHLDAVVNARTVDTLETERATIWEAGLRHALAWLGLKQYGDVMAKDNPWKADA